MSDSILAAIIAATATLSASLLQLRFSIARELAARAQSPGNRKKSRAPFIVLFVMIGASAVAGLGDLELVFGPADFVQPRSQLVFEHALGDTLVFSEPLGE